MQAITLAALGTGFTFLMTAAGAMLYVVTKELIPGAVGGGRRAAYLGTAAVVFGFVLMMALDVALG